MKRVVDVLYGLQGYPNASRFTAFKTDLFANGSTPAITMDTAATNGISVTAATTTAFRVTGNATTAFSALTGTFTTGLSLAGTLTTGITIGACTTGISMTGAKTNGIVFTGAHSGACIDFTATSVTTGTLLDYVGITGKVSGYLFNGSMTTSTLTASTIIDDFSCSSASDGAAADTLRAIRRIWSGAMPNGTAAVDFKMVELQWTSTYGTAATKGGTPMMLSLDCDATINDSTANFVALNIDLAGMTLTSVTDVFGMTITGKSGVDAAINVAGTVASAFNIAAAANVTNLFKFNAAAGCILSVDVSPNDTPSDGGLGADACIRVDIGGADYFIPLFAVELS